MATTTNVEKLQAAGVAGEDISPEIARDINEKLTEEDVDQLIRIRGKLGSQTQEAPGLVFLR